MLHYGPLKSAAEGIVSAAIVGADWEEALARFAHEGGAECAVLMRNVRQKLVSGYATDNFANAIPTYVAGQSPPNTRYDRVKISPGEGFRVDHQDYTDEDLARDPFYQEFLRPMGLFWHANVVLDGGADEQIEISLKRRFECGPYQAEDVAILDLALPELRAAARFAKRLLDAQKDGMKQLLHLRGDVIFEFDGNGRLRPGQAAGETDSSSPFRPRRGQLMAVNRGEQQKLDEAIRAAVSKPGAIGLAPLTGPDGRRHVLQVHPVPKNARDIFLSAAAVAVLIELDRRSEDGGLDARVLHELFGLSEREAAVAGLLGGGMDLPGAAHALGIGHETARSYLKRIFDKTGVRRQTELAVLLSRMSL